MPGLNDLLYCLAGMAVIVAALWSANWVACWFENTPARRERRDWDRHCRQAMRLVNDSDWPERFGFARTPVQPPEPVIDVTDASIRAAHHAELCEGSRSRHPAFRTGDGGRR